MYKLVIPGRLPCLNDFYGKTLSNRHAGNKLKQDAELEIGLRINEQLKNIHITNPVKIYYRWFEPTRKRDLDNISSFGRKCIQDALVRSGVLENDGWKNITGFADDFFIDKDNPRIEVYIKEVECL